MSVFLQKKLKRTYIVLLDFLCQRGLVGEIIKRFEAKGYKLVGLKLFQPTEELLKTHYADLSKKGFFAGSATPPNSPHQH
jgi:nucleoside-diphosphate kinase